MRANTVLAWLVPASVITVLILLNVSANNNVGSWLWGPASPGLMKWGGIGIGVYYALFGAYVWVARQREFAYYAQSWTAPPPRVKDPAPADNVVTMPARVRRSGPPTAPIPRIHSRELGLEVIDGEQQGPL